MVQILGSFERRREKFLNVRMAAEVGKFVNINFTISTDPKIIALALLSIAAGYYGHHTLQRPNGAAKPDTTEKLDVIQEMKVLRLLDLASWIFYLEGFLNAFLILTSNTPSGIPAAVCPNIDNLNLSLFTWHPFPVTCLTVLVICGAGRLQAYKDLGASFTFELVAPKHLVKTGLYSYIQHPSYPTGLGALTCAFLLWAHPHGVLGCFLPTWASNTNVFPVLFWSVFFGLAAYGVPRRVREEEAMLKREFGKEWIDYNKKTPRFIPFLI
jgi:protein-S-isoprenylcysteine O-methyltransferase Ste14